jgi:hypothetical protein
MNLFKSTIIRLDIKQKVTDLETPALKLKRAINGG